MRRIHKIRVEMSKVESTNIACSNIGLVKILRKKYPMANVFCIGNNPKITECNYKDCRNYVYIVQKRYARKIDKDIFKRVIVY